jgi:hypothetical protein
VLTGVILQDSEEERTMGQLSKSFIACLLCATLIGCSGGAPPRDQAAATTDPASPAAESGEGHAAADVVPGSYEDWCDEHAVAETACTRCDSSRIPAFKATGDWDAEHGLPKSQCLTCDPNLKIVRPAPAQAD